MAYQAGFVVAILHNGKPLREVNSFSERVVRLPFGSEYALRIQNKTHKRAYVSVKIDGTEVLSGKLVMQAGDKIDLERFCLDGDLTKGNKFKFVEAKNGGVQDPTIGDNGWVVVTFEPELILHNFHSSILRGGPACNNHNSMEPIGSTCEVNTTGNTWSASVNTTNCVVGGMTSADSGISLTTLSLLNITPEVAADVGATVEGGQSSQTFMKSNEVFITEAPVHIGIHMKGMVQEKSKPWSLSLGPKMKVLNNENILSHVDSVELTASHVVLKIPISEVKIA